LVSLVQYIRNAASCPTGLKENVNFHVFTPGASVKRELLFVSYIVIVNHAHVKCLILWWNPFLKSEPRYRVVFPTSPFSSFIASFIGWHMSQDTSDLTWYVVNSSEDLLLLALLQPSLLSICTIIRRNDDILYRQVLLLHQGPAMTTDATGVGCLSMM